MTERRIIIGLCRSGTTPLLNAFSQHPDVSAVYQPIKTGMRLDDKKPDYSFFEGGYDVIDKQFLVAKETLGHRNVSECQYQIFPDRNAILMTRPVFLLRDPVETYQSWRRLGWGNMERFLLSYNHLFNLAMLVKKTSGKLKCVFLEELIASPEETIKTVCESWDLEYVDSLVYWQSGLNDTNVRRKIYPGSEQGFSAKHHDTARQHKTFINPRMKPEVSLTEEEICLIKNRLQHKVYLLKNYNVQTK